MGYSTPETSRRKVHSTPLIVATLTVMLAYFLPFLLLGSRSYITIHDNLNGEFVVNYLLVKTGTAFALGSSSMLGDVMNGLPRATLPSGLNLGILLFYVFPPAWAYIVNFILVHIVAFGGMFLLLRKYVLPEDKDLLLAGAISICFFLVPFHTLFGLTVAGQPLLAYAFLNIRQGQHSWKDYLIILLFPVWSDMPLIAPFAVTALGLILVIDWMRSRRLNHAFLLSISLLITSYAVLQYQMAYSILGSHTWVSHRSAWNLWTDYNVHANLHRTMEILRTTQEHTGSFPASPIIVTVLIALVLLLMRKRRPGMIDVLAIAIASICIEYGFYDWIVRASGRLIPPSFNGSRFYFLLPLLWMLVFALCLKEFSRRKRWVPLVWCLVAVQAGVILKANTEYRNNIAILRGKQVYEPSFDRFFAQDLFKQVDAFIGQPKSSYRVVSVGIPPSIALFNGFYTLDAYLNNYSLAYKRQFRKIIAPELAKSPELRAYFDGWGNRCDVFSSELGMYDQVSGTSHYVLHNLDLNTTQLRAMGGEYVISAVFIEDSGRDDLRLAKEFSSPGSFWHLYLYKVEAGPLNYARNSGK
jgi:hypothetical protein